jgi:hypothetical protein
MIIGFSGLAGSGKDTAADFAVKEGFAKVALADEMKRIVRSVYGFSEQALWGPSAERSKPDALYPRAEHVYGAGQACLVCGNTTRLVTLNLNGKDISQCYLTPRYALQLLGTEWGRACHPDTWINIAIRHAVNLSAAPSLAYCGPMGVHERSAGCNVAAAHSQIARCGSANAGVVFSDVRFLNEMEAIKKAGGILIRLKRGWPKDPKVIMDLCRGVGGAGMHASETEQLMIPDTYFDHVIPNHLFESTEDLRKCLYGVLGW